MSFSYLLPLSMWPGAFALLRSRLFRGGLGLAFSVELSFEV